jgi:hydrogenase maturation protease
MPSRDRPRTVVIGLGNPLMRDDGLGLAALDRLRATRPRHVELIDGGTWGMNLLPILESADRVLLLDAVDRGLEPGTPIELSGAEVPRYLAVKLSPHQIDLRDVLALAEWRGTLPRELVVIGMQPARVEMGTELSDVLASRLDAMVANARDRLDRWAREPETVSCTR